MFLNYTILAVYGENGIENKAQLKKWRPFKELLSKTSFSKHKSMS